MERERKHNLCARAGTADASIEEGPTSRWLEHAAGGQEGSLQAAGVKS
jgi:hypothetical protein